MKMALLRVSLISALISASRGSLVHMYMYWYSTLCILLDRYIGRSFFFFFFSASILAYTFQYGEALRSWASEVF